MIVEDPERFGLEPMSWKTQAGRSPREWPLWAYHRNRLDLIESMAFLEELESRWLGGDDPKQSWQRRAKSFTLLANRLGGLA
jgi:hypothetical protein